jgi:endonuclease III
MKKILIVLVALFLSACSTEPNENEIKQALQESIKESNANVEIAQKNVKNFILNDNEKQSKTDEQISSVLSMVTGPLTYELIDMKKLGECIKNDKEGFYECKIKTVLKNSLGQVSNITIVKLLQSEDKKWIMED